MKESGNYKYQMIGFDYSSLKHTSSFFIHKTTCSIFQAADREDLALLV